MNTPAHLVLNLLALDRRGAAGTEIATDESRARRRWTAAVAAGALAPDLPMFVFYFHQKVLAGRTESYIWSEGYYDPAWQAFFDAPNSLPLIAVLAAAGWALARSRPARRWLVALVASMALHVATDLPLHHDDGHRHLFPLSDWRFSSPVSYWDPSHYGALVMPLELLLVLAGAAVLWRRYRGRRIRFLAAGVVALYGLMLVYALVVWSGGA